jgi:hypothetical protein
MPNSFLGSWNMLFCRLSAQQEHRKGLIQQSGVLLRAEQIGLLTVDGQRWTAEEEVLRGWGEQVG